MTQLIIGLVGEKAGGKGTTASHLVKKHGASGYSFGQIMRDILDRLHLPFTRENGIGISVILRKNFGENLFAHVIAEDVANDSNELIVVDGIRRMADIESLQKLPGFHLVYITADPKIRWERSRARGEKVGESETTFEQFMEDEKAPTEISIAEVAEHAEFKINNNGTFDELHDQIEKIQKQFGGTTKHTNK